MCRMETIRFLCFSGFYFVYLICGAWMFAFIERPSEEESRRMLNDVIRQFMADHQQCVSDDELIALLKVVIRADHRGVSAAKGNDSTNWCFGQAIFFAASVITTIGYGNVVPLSDGGKVFCLVYGFLGVIFTAILFEAIVLRLMNPTSKLLALLSSGLCFQRHRCVSRYRLPLFYRRLQRVVILLVFVFFLAFLVPSLIFERLEDDWTFFESFYYCFISLMTIGLGDFIPAEDPQQPYRTLYKMGATAYLYFGLVLVLLAVTYVYQIPELNFPKYFCTPSIDANETEAEEDLEERKEESTHLLSDTSYPDKDYSIT